ncbi:MAG: ester cyclase [Caldilinea sp.]|nr:ester cyclase [Caldilinea sp.]MCB0065548.1 ester cyclase [Caldilineaceae bacterium]MCW5839685.1 ester cyclase [Caldilinea sp.]HRW47540.1 ester cyclase [Caldilinea sp.]
MNTDATIIRIGRALLDGFNAKDLSEWESLLAEEYTGSYPGLRRGADRQVATAYNAVFVPAFPDLHFAVERTFADGDMIVYQWMSTGTHTGPLELPTGTVAATGKHCTVPGVLVATVKDGKIVREETYWNQLELLAQLGIM